MSALDIMIGMVDIWSIMGTTIFLIWVKPKTIVKLLVTMITWPAVLWFSAVKLIDLMRPAYRPDRPEGPWNRKPGNEP